MFPKIPSSDTVSQWSNNLLSSYHPIIQGLRGFCMDMRCMHWVYTRTEDCINNPELFPGGKNSMPWTSPLIKGQGTEELRHILGCVCPGYKFRQTGSTFIPSTNVNKVTLGKFTLSPKSLMTIGRQEDTQAQIKLFFFQMHKHGFKYMHMWRQTYTWVVSVHMCLHLGCRRAWLLLPSHSVH